MFCNSSIQYLFNLSCCYIEGVWVSCFWVHDSNLIGQKQKHGRDEQTCRVLCRKQTFVAHFGFILVLLIKSCILRKASGSLRYLCFCLLTSWKLGSHCFANIFPHFSVSFKIPKGNLQFMISKYNLGINNKIYKENTHIWFRIMVFHLFIFLSF